MSDSELNSETPIIPTETAEPAEPTPVENSHFKWYILQAHTGYEKRVKLTIEKQLEIKGLQHLVGKSSFLRRSHSQQGWEAACRHAEVFPRLSTAAHGPAGGSLAPDH